MTNLMYSTKHITGSLYHSLVQQMKSIEMFSDKTDILSHYKGNLCNNYIKQITGINDFKIIKPYLNDYPLKRKYENWVEVYDEIDVSHLKHYKNFIIFGNILSNCSAKRVRVFPYDNTCLRFISVGIPTYYTLALLKASREYKIPIHEVAHDPQEFSLDLVHKDYKPFKHYLYHGVNIPEYNMKRIDTLQYYLSKQAEVNQEKEFDFTFGYTIITKDRIGYDYSNIFDKFNKKNIYVRNKFTGENSFVTRDVYLEMISKSKYTLIVPPYDRNSVSIYRIIESLHNNCLPLINPDVRVEILNESFNTDVSELIISNKWELFSEFKYDELLSKFKKVFLEVKNKFINE